MRRRFKTTESKAPIVGGIALGIIALVAGFLLLFDFKSFFERRASAALQRPVTVADLHLRIFPFKVVLDDLKVADAALGEAAPADKPALMSAVHVDSSVGFWRLLFGDKGLTRIERQPDGTLSWDIARTDAEKASGEPPRLPEIHDLRLHDVLIVYRDDRTKSLMNLTVNTQEAEGTPPTLTVKGEGTYGGQPSTLEATGGAILTLRDKENPYPIDASMTSGTTMVAVKGAVVDIANLTGLDVTLQVAGADAADLYRLAGIALPPTPAYTLSTRLDHEGPRWMFKNLKWILGQSDLAGELVWDLSDKKPLLTGSLKGAVVALKDFGGFIGAAPGEKETPVEVRRAAADQERERRATTEVPPEEKTVAAELVIPDRAIDIAKLNSMNAEFHLEAAKIIEAGLPLDKLRADVALKDGVLTLKPLIFEANQGEINITLTMNGTKQPMTADVTAVVTGYPLERLLGKNVDNTSWGSIGGRIELHGTGNSMHRILASSNGDVGLAVGGGQISLFVVELMGIDLAETLGILLTKDKPTQIRCMVADFGIEKGRMTARRVVADTNDTIFTGTGNIDLGGEVLDMRVRAKPKDISPISLRSKLLLTGTFANPSFGPDAKAMILKGGLAAALGVILTPVASLIALIDRGGGKDADCAALIKEVEAPAN